MVYVLKDVYKLLFDINGKMIYFIFLLRWFLVVGMVLWDFGIGGFFGIV